MKRVKKLMVASLIGASVLLSACGDTKIEGRPSSVVDQAQDLKEGEKASVEVTGFVSDVYPDMVYLTDDQDTGWESADAYVICSFEDTDSIDEFEVGDRVTISGELTAEELYVESGDVWLHNCSIDD